MYQKLHEKASLSSRMICMKFYDEKDPLYMETDAPSLELGTLFNHTRTVCGPLRQSS